MQRMVASWFGSGLVLRHVRGTDAGSGTLAAAVTMLAVWGLASIGWWAHAVGAGVVVGLSLWSAQPFAAAEGDPGWVVVDEAAGTLIATVGLGLSAAVVGFVVFRVADITKRFPGVATAERLPGAIGVTADDVVAGLWGLAAGWLVQSLVG